MAKVASVTVFPRAERQKREIKEPKFRTTASETFDYLTLCSADESFYISNLPQNKKTHKTKPAKSIKDTLIHRRPLEILPIFSNILEQGNKRVAKDSPFFHSAILCPALRTVFLSFRLR